MIRYRINQQKGKNSLALGFNKGGGFLEIANNEGTPVTILFTDENSGSILLANKEGKPIVGLGADKKGGSIVIANSEGEITARLPE